jgi:hypothetical protein
VNVSTEGLACVARVRARGCWWAARGEVVRGVQDAATSVLPQAAARGHTPSPVPHPARVYEQAMPLASGRRFPRGRSDSAPSPTRKRGSKALTSPGGRVLFRPAVEAAGWVEQGVGEPRA